MAKLSRRSKTRSSSGNSPASDREVITPSPKKAQAAVQTYDAFKYIKRDLMWGATCGAICMVIMIVLYFLIR